MKKFKEKVLKWILHWEEETTFLSFHKPDQPGVRQILSFKNNKYKREIIIETILEYIQKQESWIFFALIYVVPKKRQPKIPYEIMGKFDELRDIWIKWGKENDYI